MGAFVKGIQKGGGGRTMLFDGWMLIEVVMMKDVR
jgi:hypothetical protein